MNEEPPSFGFIITRHVNSEKTNAYWNQCVKMIRTLYPLCNIVLIDDNSNYDFVKADHDYLNLQIIQSEYPARGELLPYVYYLKYAWFPIAVIIHDSTFIHTRINFDSITLPVMPLWHHPYDWERVENISRIASSLKTNRRLQWKINKRNTFHHLMSSSSLASAKTDEFFLCFGCQCVIRLPFLRYLEEKYQITNMLNHVLNRPDRCSLERVMGLLFCEECPALLNSPSLFGDIKQFPRAFQYTFGQYKQDVVKKKIFHPVVKVWTGR
jgi:hypothetical protein